MGRSRPSRPRLSVLDGIGGEGDAGATPAGANGIAAGLATWTGAASAAGEATLGDGFPTEGNSRISRLPGTAVTRGDNEAAPAVSGVEDRNVGIQAAEAAGTAGGLAACAAATSAVAAGAAIAAGATVTEGARAAAEGRPTGGATMDVVLRAEGNSRINRLPRTAAPAGDDIDAAPAVKGVGGECPAIWVALEDRLESKPVAWVGATSSATAGVGHRLLATGGGDTREPARGAPAGGVSTGGGLSIAGIHDAGGRSANAAIACHADDAAGTYGDVFSAAAAAVPPRGSMATCRAGVVLAVAAGISCQAAPTGTGCSSSGKPSIGTLARVVYTGGGDGLARWTAAGLPDEWGCGDGTAVCGVVTERWAVALERSWGGYSQVEGPERL
ncbi:hypothetical protein MMPV_005614 [Pyropia vietnamensis]